jgi:ribonuclease BN (tRNA processing enzyme)
MSEIYFLGTGGAAATEERDNTALLLHHERSLVLVDCPGSVTRKIKTLGLDPRSVSAIQVTHVHPDHIYGLPSFVHSLMLADLRIPLFGSRESIRFCRELLDLYGLLDESIRCRIEFATVSQGDRFEPCPGVECRAFHVPHKDSSLAFEWRFPAEGKALLYSGDTPVHPPLFKQAAGIDTLVHDCSVPSRYFQEYPFLPSMHANALEVGSMAQEAGVKRLIPCHFFGELDFTIGEIEDEIRRHFRGELVIPRDLMRVEL